MLEDNIETILGEKYSKNFLSNGSNYSKNLKKDGIIVFNNFININGLGILKNEAKKLKQQSFKSTSEYNVYVAEHDPNFLENSPRNRIMSTSKKCIPNDLIPKNSYLQLLYDSKLLKQFFCDILQKEILFPYEDTLSSININYYDEGDALGWHFDNSDFTITLLVKNCIKGGVYEFFNDMRYKDGKEDYAFVEKILDNEISGTKIDSHEGDLMIFKGNKSIHQVSAVEEGERILVTFNYNEKMGVSLSEKSRKTFFGRIN